MTKTIDEVRNWLDSMVGTVPPDLSDRDYDGQCVALIKNLLNFLGVPDPYSGRGNAKDFCERLDAEDFAEAGAGILNVWEDNNSPVVDSQYGHIWVQIGSDTWESNNYGSLHVSKDTLIAQPQQVWNLDKWLTNNGAGSATKGLIKMYLIFCIDTKRWYVSNGVEVRYVKTGRVLNNYQDKWAKLGLPTDTMYQAELDAEFGKNATDPKRDVAKG